MEVVQVVKGVIGPGYQEGEKLLHGFSHRPENQLSGYRRGKTYIEALTALSTVKQSADLRTRG